MELLLNPEGTLIDNAPCMAAGIDFACRLLTGNGPIRTSTKSYGLAPEAALAEALNAPAASERVKEATLLCAAFYLEHWPRLARPYHGATEAISRWRQAGGTVTAVVDRRHVADALDQLGLSVDRVETIRLGTCPLQGRLAVVSRRIGASRNRRSAWLTDWLAEWRAGLARSIPTLLAGWGRFGSGDPGTPQVASPLALVELLEPRRPALLH